MQLLPSLVHVLQAHSNGLSEWWTGLLPFLLLVLLLLVQGACIILLLLL
jgi:hypothetical protein